MKSPWGKDNCRPYVLPAQPFVHLLHSTEDEVEPEMDDETVCSAGKRCVPELLERRPKMSQKLPVPELREVIHHHWFVAS